MPARGAALAITLLTLCLVLQPELRARQAATSTPLPKVRLVATGGTISNRDGGRLTADELIKSMPGVDRYARAEAEQFANTSSSALTLGS